MVGLAALYIRYKYYQRQRLLKELRMARITVDELHQQWSLGRTPSFWTFGLPLNSNGTVIDSAARVT